MTTTLIPQFGIDQVVFHQASETVGRVVGIFISKDKVEINVEFKTSTGAVETHWWPDNELIENRDKS